MCAAIAVGEREAGLSHLLAGGLYNGLVSMGSTLGREEIRQVLETYVWARHAYLKPWLRFNWPSSLRGILLWRVKLAQRFVVGGRSAMGTFCCLMTKATTLLFNFRQSPIFTPIFIYKAHIDANHLRANEPSQLIR